MKNKIIILLKKYKLNHLVFIHNNKIFFKQQIKMKFMLKCKIESLKIMIIFNSVEVIGNWEGVEKLDIYTGEHRPLSGYL